MTLDEAKTLLASCTRQQLVDQAFGDAEVYWYDKDGLEVAGGYFGRSAEVGFSSDDTGRTEFKGDEAWELRYLGELTISERNDSQGDE